MRRSSWSRRRIIVGSASLLLLPGARASAQPIRRRPKVAFLLPTAPDHVDTPADRGRAGLAELGYVEGQTVSLEARFAHHRLERLPAFAAELVAAHAPCRGWHRRRRSGGQHVPAARSPPAADR